MHCRSDRCCVAKTLASRGAHHCMRPIFHCMCPGRRGQNRRTQSALTRCATLHVSRFPDGPDAVRKDTREVTAISGTLAHAASVRRQPGQPATVQHPPGLPAAIAFQCESNQTENDNIHQNASDTHGAAIHPPCASPGATRCGPTIFSRWQRHQQQ